MRISTPDPQHVYLDALRKSFDDGVVTLLEAGLINCDDADEISAHADTTEPESVCFMGDDLYDLDDGVVELVGSRDLGAKIAHWEHEITALNDYYA